MTMSDIANFRLAGDAAILVEYGNVISEEINQKVRNLHYTMLANKPEGVTEILPTYRSLLVCFDPLRISPSQLIEQICKLEDVMETIPLPQPIFFKTPVLYGDECGSDLYIKFVFAKESKKYL